MYMLSPRLSACLILKRYFAPVRPSRPETVLYYAQPSARDRYRELCHATRRLREEVGYTPELVLKQA